jgi:hypothetical protein
MATSKIGGGLKAVAKKAFDSKVRTLANPTAKVVTYDIVDGKVQGVPLNVLLDAVTAARHHFNNDGNRLHIARRGV